jgi:hypothetical protein
MIYMRSWNYALSGPSLGRVRALSIAALLGYPIGCLLLLLRSGNEQAIVLTVGGLGLILLAFAAAAAVAGSRFQRIAAEQPSILDEFELKLRGDTLGRSYQIFSAAVLAGIVYLAIAADTGFWMPRDYEEFNALFWGVFLYAYLLPTALLAWSADGRLVDGSDEGATL